MDTKEFWGTKKRWTGVDCTKQAFIASKQMLEERKTLLEAQKKGEIDIEWLQDNAFITPKI